MNDSIGTEPREKSEELELEMSRGLGEAGSKACAGQEGLGEAGLGEGEVAGDAGAGEKKEEEQGSLEGIAETSGGCCAGEQPGESAEEKENEEERSSEDLGKLDVHFALGLLDECMFFWAAFMCGSQAGSLCVGLGTWVLMELKRTVVAAAVGCGSGPVSFSALGQSGSLARACLRHSVWLDALLTLGCCVALKMGWVSLR